MSLIKKYLYDSKAVQERVKKAEKDAQEILNIFNK